MTENEKPSIYFLFACLDILFQKSWECSRKDFEKYQQEDRHSRYLQEHEKSRSIFPASHVGDRDGTEEGYQDTDLFVDESVDTAEQAIQNLLLEDLHQALLKLSPAERDFILSYYEMKIPNATCLAQRYGITRQAADKRLFDPLWA